ncbi:MAG: hypothetical protein K5893_12070 [Prevotella sp.]|nr:hypothetical protein [Prevotella sp.]
MQNRIVTGLLLLLSVLALLTYAYFAFLGMAYLLQGQFLYFVLLSVAWAVGMGLCIYALCKREAPFSLGNSKLRRTIARMGIGALLVVGIIPLVRFIQVYNHQDELQWKINHTRENLLQMDSIYNDYAHQRIDDYEKQLRKDKFKRKKVRALVSSLERRLLPANLDSVRSQRAEWLSQSWPTDVFSVATPLGLSALVEAETSWTETYDQLSAVIYKGEDTQVFSQYLEALQSSDTTTVALRPPLRIRKTGRPIENSQKTFRIHS